MGGTTGTERGSLAGLTREQLIERLVRAERRAEAMVEVGRLFARGLPLPEILQDVAGRVVDTMADISLVHVLDDEGPKGLLTTAVAAREPALADAIREHLARRPIRFDERVAGKVVYETGHGLLLTEVGEDDVRRLTRPDDAPLLTMLGLQSVMVLPLRGRAGVIGTMDVCSTDPERRYGPRDYDLAQEIADRVAAAVENARLLERLEARARELETIISCIADGVIVFDRDGRVTMANAAARALLRVPGELGSGEPLSPVVRRALAGEIVADAERAAIDPAGQERALRVSAAPLRDPSGAIVGAVMVVADITRLKELERARDEFLSVASHELKTPLTPLAAAVELTARSVEHGTPILPDLPDVLARQVERLDHLVTQLLDVSRARSGRLEIERRRFDLAPVVGCIAAQYGTLATRHEFVRRAPEAPVFVQGDERRIEQVLVNLLDNAVKYSPAGGRIEIALAVEGGRARVSVSDQGIGIPADELLHLFDRFRRARNAATGAFGGLGLGLFIAREIVRLHGGEIHVESEEGRGTRFEFSLPTVD